MKLLAEALIKFVCGLLLVGLLIFLPAGTLNYTYGWLLITLLFVPMLIAGFVMVVKSPELLQKRLDAKEKQGTQKGVVAFSGLMFIAGFVVAGSVVAGSVVAGSVVAGSVVAGSVTSCLVCSTPSAT